MRPTLSFVYVGKNAGQVVERDWVWWLSPRMAACCTKEYRGQWYSLVKRNGKWCLVAHIGCAWDFATGWFDWDWLKEASLGHDILHWLIRQGVIDAKYNDEIDNELLEIAKARGKTFGLAPRAWIIKRATNLLDERNHGVWKEVHHLYGGAK